MRKSKSYHHGRLRESLVEEAWSVIASEGEGGLSLRGCARSLGVDVAAVYRHFRSKEEVLAAVIVEGFDVLGHQMSDAMEEIGRERDLAEAYFLSSGRAYVSFGLAHAHLYRLMFGGSCSSDAIARQRERRDESGAPGPYELLSDGLDLLVEAGALSARERPGAEFLAWSAVHGLVSLLIDGRRDEGAEVEPLIDRCCLMVLRGLSSVHT